jgi:hypothetical protein
VTLSRAATYIEGKGPSICPVFSRKGAADVTPIYEDGAIRKAISAQINSEWAID